MKDDALFNLGKIYAELGDSAKSEQAFRKILADHPHSIYTEAVKEKLPG